WLKQLGPGLITGAADDDPSGIATYSQAGAQFGYQLGWTLVLTYPLMVGIQMVSARMGRVTGHGLASNIRRNFPRPVLYAVVALLVVANTINIAADIAAMGEALRLVAGGAMLVYAIGFGVVCLGLQIFLPYQVYVRYLKWLTLALLAYVAVVFTIEVPWRDVALGLVWPRVKLSAEVLTVIVAVFGTTISPYLFFWQAAQEVEELNADPAASALVLDPADARRHLRRIKFDTYFGMGFSNLIALFIIVSCAATLHRNGITDIATSAQAAEALRPLAGDAAFLLFSLGIIGTGMLAVPVLAGSAAYAVAETFEWKSGLDLKLLEAREFYGIIALATLGGVALDFSPIDPIKALFWSAVINGIIAVPIMVVMMLLADDSRVMGAFTVTRRLKALGWLATWTMGAAVVAMFVAA
ncbi:MAG TPA: Nramp family divalent metal transporter, partial [Casimicrobiaceae bacterium]|nr:Nramp family divalent metal transporter [Casimicrobiaceae bacterium]